MIVILTQNIDKVGDAGYEVEVPDHIARGWIQDGKALAPLPDLSSPPILKEETPQTKETPLPALRRKSRW